MGGRAPGGRRGEPGGRLLVPGPRCSGERRREGGRELARRRPAGRRASPSARPRGPARCNGPAAGTPHLPRARPRDTRPPGTATGTPGHEPGDPPAPSGASSGTPEPLPRANCREGGARYPGTEAPAGCSGPAVLPRQPIRDTRSAGPPGPGRPPPAAPSPRAPEPRVPLTAAPPELRPPPAQPRPPPTAPSTPRAPPRRPAAAKPPRPGGSHSSQRPPRAPPLPPRPPRRGGRWGPQSAPGPPRAPTGNRPAGADRTAHGLEPSDGGPRCGTEPALRGRVFCGPARGGPGPPARRAQPRYSPLYGRAPARGAASHAGAGPDAPRGASTPWVRGQIPLRAAGHVSVSGCRRPVPAGLSWRRCPRGWGAAGGAPGAGHGPGPQRSCSRRGPGPPRPARSRCSRPLPAASAGAAAGPVAAPGAHMVNGGRPRRWAHIWRGEGCASSRSSAASFAFQKVHFRPGRGGEGAAERDAADRPRPGGGGRHRGMR